MLTDLPAPAGPLSFAADRAGTARRVLLSARTPESTPMPVDRVPAWLAEQARRGEYRVTPVPFALLRGWHFEEGSGDLRHESGRFFSVEGLHVHADGLPARGGASRSSCSPRWVCWASWPGRSTGCCTS
ncbi:NDP-hexose 2,3-dehydratase family protein [Streptomyces werraensis]|nr:NDP-hexose 2,3-dehydratase family protein [Streptomyces werraensis]